MAELNRYQFCICAINYTSMILLAHSKVFTHVMILLKASVPFYAGYFIAFIMDND